MTDAAQEALLHVQELDTTLAQLDHRKRTLPERDELAAEGAARAQLDAELETVRSRRSELERSQNRFEDELATIEAKAREVDRTLYGGTVKNPRELQALQEELGALKRRQSAIEDQLLEVLDLTDPVLGQLERLGEERGRLEVQIEALQRRLAATEGEIETEIGEVNARRRESAAAVPGELLQTYERLRGQLGGVAVARLEGNRCLGCHLTLPATEVDQIKRKSPDAVVRHEECGRILVR